MKQAKKDARQLKAYNRAKTITSQNLANDRAKSKRKGLIGTNWAMSFHKLRHF